MAGLGEGRGLESQQEILARTRRRINAAKARRAMSWQDVFGKCDKDQSGYLDIHELVDAVREALKVPENTLCNYELRVLFNEMDTDKSGGVSIEELLDYLDHGKVTPEEAEAKARVRIQRVRKNLKAAFQAISSNESSIRKLFAKLDMDSDASLSLYEFKTFVRMNLKLTFWDVNNTDIEDFYRYLDKNNTGISAEEMINFVKSNNMERPSHFTFIETLGAPGEKKRRQKKTHKQLLLEDSFRSTSLPNLSRLPHSASMVSLGRNYAPAGRNVLSQSAKMFFTPEKWGT